jgi:hypothetical protein
MKKVLFSIFFFVISKNSCTFAPYLTFALAVYSEANDQKTKPYFMSLVEKEVL